MDLQDFLQNLSILSMEHGHMMSFAVETVRWQDHFLPGPVQGLCNLGLISLAFLFFALDSR